MDKDQDIHNFWKILSQAAKKDSPWMFVREKDKFSSTSFKAVWAETNCITGYLLQEKISPEALIKITSSFSPTFIAWNLAAQLLGAILHPFALADKPVEDFSYLFFEKKTDFEGFRARYSDIRLPGQVILGEQDVELTSSDQLMAMEGVLLQGKVAWRELGTRLEAYRAAIEPGAPYIQGKSSITIKDWISGTSNYKSIHSHSTVLHTLPISSRLNYEGALATVLLKQPNLYICPVAEVNSAILQEVKPSHLFITAAKLEKLIDESHSSFFKRQEMAQKYLQALRITKNRKSVPAKATRRTKRWQRKYAPQLFEAMGGRLKECFVDAPLSESTEMTLQAIGVSVTYP